MPQPQAASTCPRRPLFLPKGFLHACLGYAIQAAEKKAKQELAAAQQASKASQDGLAALGRELADANAKVTGPYSFHVHDSGKQQRQFPLLRRLLWQSCRMIDIIMEASLMAALTPRPEFWILALGKSPAI